MASIYQDFHGQFTINSANNDFAVGGVGVTLSSNTYYITGYDGEGTAQFTNHVETKIRALSGLNTSNVYYNFTSGRVVIKLTVAKNIAFTDTPLASVFGFSNTTSANAITHTGDRKPRYVWRPTNPPSDYDGNLYSVFNPQTTTRYIRSVDGSVHSVAGSMVYGGQLAYEFLPSADIVKSSAQNYQSFEEFYTDIIASGKPMRIYSDRAYSNANSFVTCVVGEEDPQAVYGYASRSYETYRGYYGIKLPLWKVP